ncbi:MAG: transporter substrate-binding domain-containing protein [Pseudomonadota bacterium]
MSLRALLLGLLVFGLAASPAHASDKVVSVATLEDYPPFCFAIEGSKKISKEVIPPGASSSRLQGYSWDILRESLHSQGYTIELNIVPWARALALTKAGKTDVLFPAGFNDERAKVFEYSKEPINLAQFMIYVKPESPVVWESLNSLNNLKVGAVRGWNYGEKWNNNKAIRKHEVNKISQLFKMLDAGRLDAVAGYEVNFDYALKLDGNKNTYRKLPPFDSSSEFVVSSKSLPNARKLLDVFDAGRREIVKNGMFDRMVRKWQ